MPINEYNKTNLQLEPRPSSVLGPCTSKIQTHKQNDFNKAYCSMGSSPYNTTNSQDQSYTILQMASSAQKGVNSNAM